MTRASRGPSPNTVCVAACQSEQPRQRFAAALAARNEFSSGRNSTAVRFCALILAPPTEATTSLEPSRSVPTVRVLSLLLAHRLQSLGSCGLRRIHCFRVSDPWRLSRGGSEESSIKSSFLHFAIPTTTD